MVYVQHSAFSDVQPDHLSVYQQWRDGFNQDFIYVLLEYIVFCGPNTVGSEYFARFNGLYNLHALAFVCTIVSIGICTFFRISLLVFLQMWCVASGHTHGKKFSFDFSFWDVYKRICWLIAGMWDDPHHGPRLRTVLSQQFAASW